MPQARRGPPQEATTYAVAAASNRYATGKLNGAVVMAINCLPSLIYGCYRLLCAERAEEVSEGARILLLSVAISGLAFAMFLSYIIYDTASLQKIFTRTARAVAFWRSGDTAGAKQELRELANGEERQMQICLLMWAVVLYTKFVKESNV